MEKIQEEINRLEKQIELDKVRLATLRGLIPQEVAAPSKPSGFILTNAMREVLRDNFGRFMTPEEVFTQIVARSNGYKPNRKSIVITLGVWVREGKVKKDVLSDGVTQGYAWI